MLNFIQKMQIKTIMRFRFSLTIKIKEVSQRSVGKGTKTDAHWLIPFWSE